MFGRVISNAYQTRSRLPPDCFLPQAPVTSTDPSRWFVRPQPNPQAVARLFCFPFAGGSASLYRTWPHLLPSNIELWAIELPGHARRMPEPLVDRLDVLVNAIATAIQPQLDRPYAFFGHSMGALVGFELARSLRCLGQPLPRLLAVSGHRAPQLPIFESLIHHLPEPEFAKAIAQLGGTPQAILDDREMRDIVLPILRTDFTVLETYAYEHEPPLNCAIAAYAGNDDTEVSRDGLNAWKLQTCNLFTCKLLPGDHFYIQMPQVLLGDLSLKLKMLC